MKKNKKISKFSLMRIILRNRFGFYLTVFLCVAGINFSYQIYHQPTEVLSILYPGKYSSLEQTYTKYSDIFHQASTPIVKPEVLASIAQVESAGRFWASPQWNFSFNRSWDKIFAPASSAFGLMQITKGHHQTVNKMCLQDKGHLTLCRDHKSWSRIRPAHSAKIASVYIDNSIRRYIGNKKQPEDRLVKAAAVAHLCGEKRLSHFVSANFSFRNFTTCGSHNVIKYANAVLDSYYKLKKTM